MSAIGSLPTVPLLEREELPFKCETMINEKDLKNAELRKTDNPSKNSEITDSIRNQLTVDPEDYPADKRKETPAYPKR